MDWRFHLTLCLNRNQPSATSQAHRDVLDRTQHFPAVAISHPAKFGKPDAVVVLFQTGPLRIAKAGVLFLLLEHRLSHQLGPFDSALFQLLQPVQASCPRGIEVFQGLLQSLRRCLIQPVRLFVLLPVDQHSTPIRVAGMGPAEFEQLLLQGQCTIEDKTTRTGETTHLMPLVSIRPQFKPISLQTNLDPPFFAFCSPHPSSLTQLDSGFNIQFLRCPEGIEYSRHRAVHPRHQRRGFSRWIGKNRNSLLTEPSKGNGQSATITIAAPFAATMIFSPSNSRLFPASSARQVAPADCITSMVFNPITGTSNRMSWLGLATFTTVRSRLSVEASPRSERKINPARSIVASVPSMASTATHADSATTTVWPMSCCAS